MKTSTKNESSFLHHVFKFCHAWPGPKPAKRPSECFGFLGLLDGPAAGGPEMDDCLGKICYGVPEMEVCLEIIFFIGGLPGKDFIKSDSGSHLLEADICLEGLRLLRLASDVLLDLDIMRSECE